MGLQNTTNVRDACEMHHGDYPGEGARTIVQVRPGGSQKSAASARRRMRDARCIMIVFFFFVTTLQGWAYKTQTRKMHARCIMIVCCFLCNNIARMGLQNTTNTRDACEHSDAFFVTILQGWVYKTQPTCERCMRAIRRFLCNNIARMGLQNTFTKHNQHARDACEQSDAFFVTTLQGWVYKTQPTFEMQGWV